MDKEALIALGLTEEQADKIISGYGKMVPKSLFENKVQEVKDLQKEIANRDIQLEELKKIDTAGLQNKITELQQQNKTDKAEYEAKIKDTQLKSALKLALAGKVHDADLVASLIDKATIELDEEGNVKKGLDEQLKTLQESKSFLFVPESQTLPKGTKPAESKKGDKDQGSNENYGKQIAEKVLGNTQYLADARKSYFQ